MNTAPPLPCASCPEAASAEAVFEAAVVRGAALIGVLAGFTRRVFGLGRVTRQVLDRLEKEGADPYATETGFDLKSAMTLLQRALHLADALRARLLTPAVAIALLSRKGAERRPCGTPRAARKTEEYRSADPLWRITYLRADEPTRVAYQQAIADMSDGEVIAQIHADLSGASAMLGDTEEAARAAVLAQRAAGLVGAADTDVAPATIAADMVVTDVIATSPGVPDDVPRRRADLAMSGLGSDSSTSPPARAPLEAVGRGPPF